MKRDDLIYLARLRILVGYLGEKKQFSWWESSFLSVSSSAFLTPVFGKTSFLAQYYGVKEAASRVHDERIGIGSGVFHLFRLPEALEQGLHGLLTDTQFVKQITGDISNEENACHILERHCKNKTILETAVGPTCVSNSKDIERSKAWQTVAGYYLRAFKTNNQVFPYFSEAI